MDSANEQDEQRQERKAERLAQDRRQKAALLAVVRRQTDRPAPIAGSAPGAPAKEENRSSPAAPDKSPR
jgi:hypothetical protein